MLLHRVSHAAEENTFPMGAELLVYDRALGPYKSLSEQQELGD
jgi:hypothetical protein